MLPSHSMAKTKTLFRRKANFWKCIATLKYLLPSVESSRGHIQQIPPLDVVSEMNADHINHDRHVGYYNPSHLGEQA